MIGIRALPECTRREDSMRLINQLQSVNVSAADGRSVEASVRVRGADLRVGGRGVVFEQCDPMTVLVHGRDSVTRLALPPSGGAGAVAACIVAPVAARIIVRVLRNGGRG